jgi:hypothetical protein
MKKKTHEEYLQEIKDKHLDIEVLENYDGAKKPILHKCKNNHIWMATPTNILRGHGCPDCSLLYRKTVLSSYTNEYIEKLKSKNIKIRVLDEYINVKTPIKHICEFGHTWDVTPNAILSGAGCPICSRKIKKTMTMYLEELNSKNITIKPLEEYILAKTPILHICEYGHKWYITPDHVLRGIGCPICNQSKGENVIKEFFDLSNIYYIPQKEFEGLVGLKGGNLSYDFYLPDYNLLIEYQGQYHDGTVNNQTQKQFKKQQEHDKRKREYANKYNIKLLEIWYYDFDNIEEILNKELII